MCSVTELNTRMRTSCSSMPSAQDTRVTRPTLRAAHSFPTPDHWAEAPAAGFPLWLFLNHPLPRVLDLSPLPRQPSLSPLPSPCGTDHSSREWLTRRCDTPGPGLCLAICAVAQPSCLGDPGVLLPPAGLHLGCRPHRPATCELPRGGGHSEQGLQP